MKKTLSYTENNLMDLDGNMYLTVDSLIKINNIITGSNNITLRKVNVKPSGFDEMYMDSDLMENKLYQIIYQLNERKIMSVRFPVNKINPFYDGNGRTCNILFVNEDKIIKLINKAKNKKTNNIKRIFIALNPQSLQRTVISI